ncbi:anaerobic ribonucleoside-triphosphate reductase [Pelotomaculum terephthalicicum JT]|uniref:anaerobic ribonucleoside-triphosphate reductase n=1 Tax=Pelotomaculum TaxID=191373 RepID=UPI0009CB1AB3|nr:MULTISPECIES: anaerobic ribonucleoside-triphosphate reductase [Pelotomaculum]MCG9968063.1 anaerobic ribonucleoside-triphosphate reductase [Pelotomaculum terephthalicicum JT]OPX85638.1 MAG: Anaerobic ribonucleoside-triphosphate reductase [Pelotomaculum sp. PtaB.Bin117]OPY63990.1 MAG: Anaerobic ribonucleoside-triphosphate reductase [Pelotomaculum sp. PtaU1.Bin065]
MFKTVQKRDGREVPFDETKITDAIFKAARAVGGEDRQTAMELTIEVIKLLKKQYNGKTFGVEDVQDIVEKVLIEAGHARTAKAYILYRDRRTRIREAKGDLMDAVEEILEETNRENANISNSPSAKMLQIASAASRKYYLTRLIPEEMSQAHLRGDIHIHDLDFYGKTLTCLQIPLNKLLSEGFNTGHGYIRPPKRLGTATALATIILQSSQNDMHGGQSFAFFDRDIAPFVSDASDFETYQAMEALIYNLNSMHSRAGAQVPFSSINIGTETSEPARRVVKNLLLAYEAGLGKGENPIFPNIIFRVKEGINLDQGDPNYDLFQLAIRVASKRLNPTFSFMDSSFNSQYGCDVSYMGCRTRVMANRRGPEVTDCRGNLSFTTINLPRVAIKAERNLDDFYRGLSGVMDLAVRQLYHRYTVQAKLKVKDMPFIMGQKLYLDSNGLKPDDPIEEAIKHGTLSVGFIGLAETLTALTGRNHGEDEESQALGQEIVAFMRSAIDGACERYNLNYTLLATPAEGLSGRFVGLDCKEFGLIPGVTTKEYYTNSFHIPVDQPISAYDKIKLEGPYHKYCNAGHISYVEMASPPLHNPEAVEAIIRHMRECDMGYGGINFPVDFCTNCNLLSVINEDTCPRCGSADISRVRRITGYLSTTDRFNDSKLYELRDRVTHM